MRTSSALCVALAMVLLPSFADASPPPPDYRYRQPVYIAQPPPPPPRPERPKKPFERDRTYLSAGYMLGAMSFGDVSGFAIGGQMAVGRRYKRFDFQANYTLLNAGKTASYDSDEPSIRGMFQRGGAELRYRFGRFGGKRKRSRIQQTFDIGAGVGMQRMRWFDGGILTRPDVALSLSSRTGFRMGDWKTAKIGYLDMGLQSFIARGPKMKDSGVTCAGPCDEPTGPFRWDVGVMWVMGFSYGR